MYIYSRFRRNFAGVQIPLVSYIFFAKVSGETGHFYVKLTQDAPCLLRSRLRRSRVSVSLCFRGAPTNHARVSV